MDTVANHSSFLGCDFIWQARDLPGEAPYLVFQDEQSHTFLETLVTACRGEAGFRGLVSDAAAASRSGVLVFIDGPTWDRQCDNFAAVWTGDVKPQVVLYFTNDPSGFWDFAIACGDRLDEIFHAHELRACDAHFIEPFLEHWTGARVAGGRITPFIKYHGKDYAPKIEANGASVARVLAALADEESRATYARILFGTQEQVFSAFADRVFGAQQYMEIAKIRPGDVIANCGVDKGWELPYFLARLRGEGEVHNFDPSIRWSLTAFSGFIGRFAGQITDHRLILSDHDGVIRLPIAFSEMVQSDQSARAGGGDRNYKAYPCLTLDSVWSKHPDKPLDFLKMDVEGGESYILRGALGTIRAKRPKLAIAIYHEIEHFWDYPAYLLDHLEGYRYYVRQYGYSRFETLLYAIPDEDDASRSGGERLARPAAGARRPSRIGDASFVFYFRDRADTPRVMYNGTRRILARFAGMDWSTADFRPAPEIDAGSTVVGVVERDSGLTVFATHTYADSAVQLIAGASADGVDIDWRASTGVSEAARCHLVRTHDGEPRVLIHEAEMRAARLCRFDGSQFVTEFDLQLAETPVDCRFDADGVLTVQALTAERTIVALRIGSAGRLEEGEPLALPEGRVAGPVVIRRRTAAGVERVQGIAIERKANGDVLVIEVTPQGVAMVDSIELDRRFEIVPLVGDFLVGNDKPGP